MDEKHEVHGTLKPLLQQLCHRALVAASLPARLAVEWVLKGTPMLDVQCSALAFTWQLISRKGNLLRRLTGHWTGISPKCCFIRFAGYHPHWREMWLPTDKERMHSPRDDDRRNID